MKPNHHCRWAVALLAASSSLACLPDPWDDLVPSPGPSKPRPKPPRKGGPPDGILDPTRRVDVELTIDPADWGALRVEGKSLFDQFPTDVNNLEPFDYATYRAIARIDGERYTDVGVRKMGFFGGLSVWRPSLVLTFPDRGDGLRTMVLNNSMEEPSYARECLAFELFRRAGYPASRCGFVRVVVNGQDLGTYTHVEGVDERMLARHFEHGRGALFAGELADFDPSTMGFIQHVSGPASRKPLERLARALEADDDQLLDRLGRVLDLDRFRDFWALETLLGQWDGYANVANNYYAYLDPKSSKFVFLPRELDGAFVGMPAWRPGYEITVYYGAKIANRLYQIPEERARFRARLVELNDALWNDAELVAKASALASIAPESDPGALAALQDWLRAHDDELREALALPAPEVPPFQPFTPPPPLDECSNGVAPISGTFTTTFIANPYEATPGTGNVEFEGSIDGAPYPHAFFGAAGPNPYVPNITSLAIQSELPNGQRIGITFMIPTPYYGPG
ncbi:MAG: CotH kinase family protein, partial [Pseudomonadota bacterium]